jgi:hypothetical protein
VRVLAVDEDGQVHFAILPGPISKNRHLLDHDPSAHGRLQSSRRRLPHSCECPQGRG